ncbi:DUF4328 domain-containing protein [Nocardioides sp. W7]|uniref:DUF4328 domain-containing protein n=1 Tax=Nocardioides sp. W7 TaxID=2931390 RepID=UPI001FD3A509|nr:DUF4328 domain-containing protein [Nocardioides sp. W7]
MSVPQPPWPPPYPRPADRCHPPEHGDPGAWSHSGPPPQAPSTLAVGVIVLALLLTAVQVSIAVAAWPAGETYRQAARDGLAPSDVFTVYDGLTVLLFPTLVGCYVVSCLWLQRCRANLDRFAPHLDHARSPIWTWLGWWVPVVSLWFPYQVVRDAQHDHSTAPRVWLGWWWAGWLGFLFLSQGTAPLTSSSDAIDETLASALPVLETMAAVALVVALVPWVGVVRRTTAAQRRLVEPR